MNVHQATRRKANWSSTSARVPAVAVTESWGDADILQLVRYVSRGVVEQEAALTTALTGQVRAVIFDYKCLFGSGPASRAGEIRAMLENLQAWGVQVCVFSTNPLDLRSACAQYSYPPLSHLVTQNEVAERKNRGSPNWVDAATAELRLMRHELLYVGSTSLDWRTAINAGVFYLHAAWSQAPRDSCLVASDPRDVLQFLYHFLLRPPRWSYRLDDGQGFHLRSLLPAGAVLPSTNPASSFRLQDVLTYGREIKVGDASARNLLMLHVLSSCYVEGLLGTNPFFCIYPSSRMGQYSEQIEEYARPAASLVHGWYKRDLLVRGQAAPDTSLARVRARNTGQAAGISMATQANSVHVGSGYRTKLAGKQVVVFDDFTTTGMSLEWARNLLKSAGASRVVMLTIGKYKRTHDRYELRPDAARIDPFSLNSLADEDFSVAIQPMLVDDGVADSMSSLFSEWIQYG